MVEEIDEWMKEWMLLLFSHKADSSDFPLFCVYLPLQDFCELWI